MKPFSYLFGLSFLFAGLGALAAPASVGLVDFAKGKVSAQHPSMGSRGLATKANIYGQDLVETGDQSFSVLRFKDNNKVTVRPLSRFAVANAAAVRLEQGSLNVESGASRLVINTSDAKVEARQARLEVRVCKQDCTVTAKDTKVVAKVVNKTGQVRAGNRALAEGSALYESDRLSSGPNGQLLAVFTDGGRISLGPDTEINIKEYRYGKTAKDRSTLQLIKGSLRSVTGQIGKSVPENYSIQTPVATMGVRGTSFDLVYPVNAKGQRGAGKGLLAQVRQGSITQRNAAGTFTLSAGKTNFIGSQQQAPTGLAAMPAASHQALGQKPEEAKANLQQLFGTQGVASPSSGTYVHVESGQVTFISESGADKGKRLTLGKGQSAFVDESGNMWVLVEPLISAPQVVRLEKEETLMPESPGSDNTLADKTADDIGKIIERDLPGSDVFQHCSDGCGGMVTGLNYYYTFDRSMELTQKDLQGTQGIVYDDLSGEQYSVDLVHKPSSFDYMSWGQWNGNVEVQSQSQTYTGGHFIVGSMTSPNNMPQSGTAVYTGSVRGDYMESGVEHDDLGGTVSLTADFGNQSVQGGFNFQRGDGTTLATASFSNTSIEHGNMFHGQLSPNSGGVSGFFYGPEANEVGGSFYYYYNGYDQLNGVFGAKR
jgi:hypothetical protein